MVWPHIQQKKPNNRKSSWVGELEVTAKWEWGGGEKERGWQYKGDLHKIKGLAPFCQWCKETLKISHPPTITTIFEKFDPTPFWRRGGGGLDYA